MPDPTLVPQSRDASLLAASDGRAAALIAVSAPDTTRVYTSAAIGCGAYRATQELFGFEAQLRVFAGMLSRLDRPALFLPAPEAFATRTSFAYLARVAGLDCAPSEILHVRFGMVRAARVLKGAMNVMAAAESPVAVPLNLGRHPFGGGTTLPAAFTRCVRYDARQAAPVGIGGLPVPTETLPPAYRTADLDDVLAHGTELHPRITQAGSSTIQGLHIRSLAEFDPYAWEQQEHAASGGQSLDLRRAMALQQMAETHGEPRLGFIMVPWNLADPASIIPDIVVKLCRSLSPDRLGYRLVLFPYNEGPESARAITTLIDRCRERLSFATELRCIFLARLHSIGSAVILPRLFSLAWAEAADPERFWTLPRLARLGIPVIPLGVGGDAVVPEMDGLHVPFAAAADEKLAIPADDEFGERIFAARTLSTRALGTLVARSVDDIRRRSAQAADPGHPVAPEFDSEAVQPAPGGRRSASRRTSA